MSIDGLCKVGRGSSILNEPCGAPAGTSGTVTQINQGTGGILLTPDPITTTGTVSFVPPITEVDKLNYLAYNGVTESPLLSTTPTSTTFDISAGELKFYDYTSVPSGGSPVETIITFGGAAGVAGTQFDGTNLFTHVSIDIAGTIVQRNRETSPIEGLTEILIGNLNHTAPARLTFDTAITVPHALYGFEESMRQYIRSRGGISMFGLDVIATPTANLEIQHTIGTGLRMGGGYIVDGNNPNMPVAPAVNPVSFVSAYIDGTGALILAAETILDPNNYNNNGVLTVVPNMNFTIQRVFFFYTSNIMLIYYGPETYNTLEAAVSAIVTESFTEHVNTFAAAPVAFIVGEEGSIDNNQASEYTFLKAPGIRSGFSTGGGTISATDLQLAYDNGNTITSTLANGVTTITDGSAGANAMLIIQDQTPSPVLTVATGSTTVGNQLLVGSGGAAAVTLEPFAGAAGNTSEIRFRELTGGGTEHVGFKAPDAIGGNVIWVLPSVVGTTGQVLTRAAAASTMEWTTPAAGGGGSVGYIHVETTGAVSIPGNIETGPLTLAGSVSASTSDMTYNNTLGLVNIITSGLYTVTCTMTCNLNLIPPGPQGTTMKSYIRQNPTGATGFGGRVLAWRSTNFISSAVGNGEKPFTIDWTGFLSASDTVRGGFMHDDTVTQAFLFNQNLGTSAPRLTEIWVVRHS